MHGRLVRVDCDSIHLLSESQGSLPSLALCAAGDMASLAGGGEPPVKRFKLAAERAAPMPSGANLIEVDGKSCTHEVAWPPGRGFCAAAALD